MSRPRIKLNGLQVFGSAMAAVTGAVLASSLGVAGTVIGAGLASCAGTAGAAVYNHYLRRTSDALGPVIVARAHQWTPGTFGAERGEKPVVAAEVAFRENAAAGGEGIAAGDAVAAGLADQAGLADEVAAGEVAAGGADEAGAEADIPGNGGGDGSGDSGDSGGEDATGGSDRRRRWVVYGGATLGIFVIVMGAITVFELLTGQPLSSTVWNHKSSGTTLGSVVGGHASSTATPTPTPTSTATNSPQSTASPTPAASATASANASPPASATATP